MNLSLLDNNAGTLWTTEPSSRLVAVCHGRSTLPNGKNRPEAVADAARLAACWNACHGLTLPPDVPAGILAELVTAAGFLLAACDEWDRRAIQQGLEGQAAPPRGERWAKGTANVRAILAKFLTETEWNTGLYGSWARKPEEVSVEFLGVAESNEPGLVCASFNAA